MGRERLRLLAEHNAIGMQASVFDVAAKKWIAPSEVVDNIEQGKLRAEEHAREYLRKVGNLDLPALEWKKARST